MEFSSFNYTFLRGFASSYLWILFLELWGASEVSIGGGPT